MPEISPELAARIEALQASHAGNPARFFMPLASAYREAGEVGLAEELLRENLKRHPGYLSAHVLLGRCLADRAAYAEARNEFQYVLSVDSQNLIALRTLGDMAASGGDTGEARRWYSELLSVDPMNVEARQALAGLDQAPARPAATEAQGESGGFGMVEIAPPAAEADLPHAGDADPGAWGAIRLDEPAETQPSSATATDEFDALDFGAVDLSVADEQPEQSASAQSEPADESPAEPSQAAAGGFDSWGSVDDGQVDLDGEGMEPLPLETFYDEAVPAIPAVPADDHEEHGEVVTETIAELYAQQGFPDRAIEVYRELISRRGEEPALVRRLGELEAQMRGGESSDSAPAETESAAADDFAPIDFGTHEPADATEVAEEAEEAVAAPSWLDSVDAFVAGGSDAASDEPQVAGDAGLPEPEFGGDFDLPAVDAEPAFASAAPSTEEAVQPAYAHAGALTGDAFADSFANGFDGDVAPRADWEAPSVEETEPTPEVAGAFEAADETVDVEPELEPAQPLFAAPTAEPVFAEPSIDAEASAEAEPSADEPVAVPSAERVSIAAYLGAILAWRPGAAPPAPAAPAPVEDAAAPPPARPWDEETLGAPVEQPPMDEPWMAESSSADAPVAEPWSAPEPATSEPAADEPWAGAAEPQAADEPWSAPSEADDEAGEDLPWMSTEAVKPEPADEGTEPATAEPISGAAPMPWDASFDLSAEVPSEPTAERAPPRQEPEAEPAGGFSFEDFFSEPAADAAPAEAEAEPALPEPLPPAAAEPAAPPQAQGGGDEDEDLESFQAWLQSLKR